MLRRPLTDILPQQAPAPQVEWEPVRAFVVTFNSERHLPALVDSLVDSPVREVVVVDNGSTDGTLDVVDRSRDRWAKGGVDVHVVRSSHNGGYSFGINIARRHARTTGWILVLNPDVEVAAGAVKSMLEAAMRDGAGALVPAMLTSDGQVFPSLRREPTVGRAMGDAMLGARFRRRPRWSSETVWDAGSYERSGTVDWATGAAVLISPDCAEAVGDWDERFFLYSEETDYLRRVRDAGFSVRYEPSAQVVHAGSGSGASDGLTALMTVNRVEYYAKHHNPAQTQLFRAAVVLHCILRVRQPAFRSALRQLVLTHRARARRPQTGGPTP